VTIYDRMLDKTSFDIAISGLLVATAHDRRAWRSIGSG
jgi:hypothetical protein